MMKQFTFTLLLFTLCTYALAQDFEIPEQARFETVQDYKDYDELVLACSNWLVDTPLGQAEEKRIKANGFFLKWLTGAPHVSVGVQPYTLKLSENTHPMMLMVFMAGWTNYVLSTGDNDDKVAANLAGLDFMMRFYTSNQVIIGKVKGMEKIIALRDKGKLKSYVKKRVANGD